MPKDELLNVLSVYPDGTPVAWCKRNRATWAPLGVMNRELPSLSGGSSPGRGVRRLLSAPGDGSMTRHKREQARVIAGCTFRQGELGVFAMFRCFEGPTNRRVDQRCDAGRLSTPRALRERPTTAVEIESEKATFEVPSPAREFCARSCAGRRHRERRRGDRHEIEPGAR